MGKKQWLKKMNWREIFPKRVCESELHLEVTIMLMLSLSSHLSFRHYLLYSSQELSKTITILPILQTCLKLREARQLVLWEYTWFVSVYLTPKTVFFLPRRDVAAFQGLSERVNMAGLRQGYLWPEVGCRSSFMREVSFKLGLEREKVLL